MGKVLAMTVKKTRILLCVTFLTVGRDLGKLLGITVSLPTSTVISNTLPIFIPTIYLVQ